MRNRMITYVNKALAESDGLSPVRLALCHDSGVTEHVRWKNMTLKARQDIFNSVLEHFRAHGYSVRTFGQDDLIEISHNYPEIYNKDKMVEITNQVVNNKIKNDIPNAISIAINAANAAIETEAKRGRYRCEVDLKENINYPDVLTWSDRVTVYQHVFAMLKGEGYYVHFTTQYHRAIIIWGEEAEQEWQNAHAPKVEEPKKKKGLFSRKKKGA